MGGKYMRNGAVTQSHAGVSGSVGAQGQAGTDGPG